MSSIDNAKRRSREYTTVLAAEARTWANVAAVHRIGPATADVKQRAQARAERLRQALEFAQAADLLIQGLEP